MDHPKVHQTDYEVEQMLQSWHGSPAHKWLYNQLVAMEVSARTELESATCETLPKIQGKLQAIQGLFTTVNKKGNPPE